MLIFFSPKPTEPVKINLKKFAKNVKIIIKICEIIKNGKITNLIIKSGKKTVIIIAKVTLKLEKKRDLNRISM